MTDLQRELIFPYSQLCVARMNLRDFISTVRELEGSKLIGGHLATHMTERADEAVVVINELLRVVGSEFDGD